jgi:hypothetical protein
MIPALERFIVGIGVVPLHNFPELPSIDWFEEVSKDATTILHARHFLSLDNLKVSSNAGFAGHAPWHSESFPGHPCVLRESGRLDAKTLVANARTKSQPHLLAISKRKSLEDAVTDVLVTRGNREVVNSVANNNGARFSGFGFLHMIKRAEGDSILAEQLGLRKDIPRHLFQQLIAKASDDVRKRLERERPEMVGQIQTSVTDVTGALHSKFGPASKSYFIAKRAVATLHRYGNLNENSIFEYARSHKHEEVTIGLSLLCSLPGDVIERALADKNREMILVLAKALDFSWATTMSLLFLAAKDHRITARDLNDMENEFGHLNIETSRSVLKFYQSRKNAARAGSDRRRLPPLHVH